jgi:hypothetical protein
MLRIVILFLVSIFTISGSVFAEWIGWTGIGGLRGSTDNVTNVSDITNGDLGNTTTPPAGWAQSVQVKWDQKPKDLNSSTEKDNLLGIEEWKLRKWDVDMNTIPLVIVNIISVLLGVAGTVAVFSLIYHAVQMQISSGITGDSSGVDKAKKWMIGSLIWFVIAISAWFLVTRAVDLLSTIS